MEDYITLEEFEERYRKILNSINLSCDRYVDDGEDIDKDAIQSEANEFYLLYFKLRDNDSSIGAEIAEVLQANIRNQFNRMKPKDSKNDDKSIRFFDVVHKLDRFSIRSIKIDD